MNIEQKIKNAVKLQSFSGNLQNWFTDPLGDVNKMNIQGNNIYMGGAFSFVKSSGRPGIDLFGQSIRALKIVGSTLYAGGSFLYINGAYTPKTIIAVDLLSGLLLPFNAPNIGTAYSLEANTHFYSQAVHFLKLQVLSAALICLQSTGKRERLAVGARIQISPYAHYPYIAAACIPAESLHKFQGKAGVTLQLSTRPRCYSTIGIRVLMPL